jgi:serine/threonine protein kinase
LHQILEDKDHFYLVMDFFKGGSVLEMLGTVSHNITEQVVINFLYQTLSGISAAHSVGVVHGRINPRYIFVSQTEDLLKTNFYLANFGCTPLNNISEIITKPGNEFTIAPEI